ncbi:tetratricopeptide repeat protein [Flavobacterium johnsoniae]|uniref:tetratricopeptide repeat protein n=1 Tax=Flavobacterium johnsoniae TaxID=986 RepID=UPI001659A948|nr:tetratricopeptide repeat protein [Flavobacterium johnsoniae]
MNVTDYTYLMNKPDAITEKQAEALGSVLNEFPYFQSARALRLKGLYNQNSFKYNYALKVTAAHTADRSVLFDFITSETFTSIQNDFYDQKLKDLLEIKVFDSEVVTFEEVKKAPEVRIDPIEQSILKSIKEATTVVFEEPSKIQQKTEETESNTFAKTEEPVIEEQPTLIIPSEEEILSTFKEVNEVEENQEEVLSEQPIAILNEEEIFNSFKEVTRDEEETTQSADNSIEIFEEEETKTSIENEEIKDKPVEGVVIESVITPSEEEILNTFKEVTETEEPVFEPAPEEETIAAPSEEEILDTFKKVEEVEEKTADPIIQKPVVKATFFDEFVDDEIAEVQVDPIENPVLVSIKEAANVTFEEPAVTEETKTTEEPEVVEEITEKAKLLEFGTPEIETSEIEIPETVKEAQENLEIGKPIDFSVSEKHSFQEWLQLARAEPIDRSESENGEKKTTETTEIVTVEEEKKKKAEIIDRFIETNPKISPIKPTMATPPIQLNSNEEDNSYLMTETLARVYLEQKKYTKAIQAYEILILKYPEKISFFADRISDIKILQQNNNNN